MNSEIKTCLNCKNSFTIEPDDFAFYEKMKVPAPTFCPGCRQERRMLYRNFKTFYKRPSDLSGKSMISMYAPDAPYVVYESAEWWGDSWDPLTYGKEVDLEKPFLPQLDELFHKVPRPARQQVNCTNSEYVNMAIGSKNCYLVFGCVDNEDCNYGHIVWNCKDSIDTLYLFKSESCYECVDCLNSCNLLFFSQECEGCADSIGLFDCRGCTNCIGCVGLVNKSYHVFNQPVSKEEYKKIKDALMPLSKKSVASVLEKREALRQEVPQRALFGIRNNDVSGNHIYNAHNVQYGFDIKSGENSKYVFTVRSAVESYDGAFSTTLENCYEVLHCVGKNLMFSHICHDAHDVSYSEYCYSSHDLFGCFGLRNKSYCILNKQYEKEEYIALRDKIIEKMKERGEFGTFFPKEMSPFAYNESTIHEYIPRTKEEALALGFRWQEEIPGTRGQGTKEFSSLPKDPKEYTDELLKEVFTCTGCTKNFRLISAEIRFYQKLGISIPEFCFNCRQAQRMAARLPRTLFPGACVECKKDIKTAYSPKDQSKYALHCEQCYQQKMG